MFKIKSFKQFLNEFEIEGEHQEDNLLKEIKYIDKWFDKNANDLILSTNSGNFIRTCKEDPNTKVYNCIIKDNDTQYTIVKYDIDKNGDIIKSAVFRPDIVKFIYKIL
jgi:hypothetical protein